MQDRRSWKMADMVSTASPCKMWPRDKSPRGPEDPCRCYKHPSPIANSEKDETYPPHSISLTASLRTFSPLHHITRSDSLISLSR